MPVRDPPDSPLAPQWVYMADGLLPLGWPDRDVVGICFQIADHCGYMFSWVSNRGFLLIFGYMFSC